MGFELRYPSGGPYTTSFLPAATWSISGSSDKESDGIAAQLAADQRTMWAQQFNSAPATKYTRAFPTLTASERTALRTFKNTVKGAAFDFTDGTCGPQTSYKKVKFAPDGFVQDWAFSGGQKQGTTLIMVDSD